MKSMTGFAAIEKESEGVKLSIRVRSVNGRFFEFKPHMPADYFPLESEIKKRVNKSLRRGTVDIYIHRKNTGKKGSLDVVANDVLASKWAESYANLASALELDSKASMEQISRVPGVIQVEEQHKISDEEKSFFLSCLEEVLEACTSEKQREGKATLGDLNTLVDGLERNVVEISKHREAANEALKERYLEKLEKLGLKEEIDPARLAQEIVIQVDKLDITEELFRLKEHFRAIRELFSIDDSPLGKRLDFFSQELLREINTIGSKSQIADITSFVVDSKGIIERFREIVQNVE